MRIKPRRSKIGEERTQQSMVRESCLVQQKTLAFHNERC